MIRNRKMPKFLAVTAVAASMILGLTGCGQQTDGIDPQYVAQLEKECVELRNQVQSLQSQLGDLEQSVVLKSYTLKAVPNGDRSGASIQISVTPMRYEEGQNALFLISLNNVEITTVEGIWNGSTYEASVELPAEDGYSYECHMQQPDGSENRIVISSPESPIYESCVYLASGLSVYCNMFVEDWKLEDKKLVVTTGYAQVQLPKIGSSDVDYSSSELVLKLGDAELQRVPIEIPRGEGEGSYEMVLENIRFDMPELEEEQQLDLSLEVTLSDGKLLSYTSCSWFYTDDVLTLAVG